MNYFNILRVFLWIAVLPLGTFGEGEGSVAEAGFRGRAPLHDAVIAQCESDVFKLLTQGVAVDPSEQSGATPLSLAVRNGNTAIVKALLEAGANPLARENDGCSILYIAARHGHAEVVKLLLDAGLNPQDGMLDGMTALHVAALNGHLGVVDVLVDAGADLWITDRADRRAIDFAEQFDHPEVVAFLEETIAFQAIQVLFHEDDRGERPEVLDTQVDGALDAGSVIFFGWGSW